LLNMNVQEIAPNMMHCWFDLLKSSTASDQFRLSLWSDAADASLDWQDGSFFIKKLN